VRFLVSIQPANGHLHLVLPVAQALRDAGHEVAFATGKSFGESARSLGFEVFAAGLDWEGWFPPEVSGCEEGKKLEGFEQLRWGLRDGFAGVLAERMAQDLLKIVDAWAPDAIVRDTSEFASWAVAERKDVPFATIEFGMPLPRRFLKAMVGDGLARLRCGLGLAPDAEFETLGRYLTLACAPPSYQIPGEPRADTTHLVRPCFFDRIGDEGLPAWIEELDDRPLVYATLGTIFNDRPEIFDVILRGLASEPVNLIMTVGRDLDPNVFGPQPDHVRIERYIPQTLLLPRCDAVVAHSGYPTVMGILSHGLPSVLFPLAVDKPFHAERCRDLGVSIVIEPEEIDVKRVRGALRTILSDTNYRAGAQRIRKEIEALPGLDYTVKLLEDLARKQEPIVPSRPWSTWSFAQP